MPEWRENFQRSDANGSMILRPQPAWVDAKSSGTLSMALLIKL